MLISGIKPSPFVSKSGDKIEGSMVFLEYPLDKSGGLGMGFEKIYLTKEKIASLSFTLTLGLSVEPLYNRFGKAAGLRLLDDGISIDY